MSFAFSKRLRVLICSLLIAALCGGCEKKSSPAAGPNVLLIIVDTLGAKHLTPYNPALDTSPNINTLAHEGVLFENAYAAAPWTKASIASIFTGLLPSHHGTIELTARLAHGEKTIAQYLSDMHYASYGAVSHTFIAAKLGYGQGFQRYELVHFKGNVHDSVTSDGVTDMGISWLKQRDTSNNFFLFLHYFDPHYNYQHHPKFDRTAWYHGQLTPGTKIVKLRQHISDLSPDDIRYLQDLYHEEIAFTDFQIGRLFAYMKEQGLLDNTIVIFTADHGEEFMEHGWLGHTRTLYDELLHVPLIVRYPQKFSARAVQENVTNMDILPTVLSLLGDTKDMVGLDGKSLLPYLSGNGAGMPDRKLISEVDFHTSGIDAHKIGMIQGPFKLILDKPTNAWELYNRASDPDEKKNLAAEQLDQKQDLKSDILTYQTTQPRPHKKVKGAGKSVELEDDDDEGSPSPEEQEQLKSLGYAD